MANVPLPSCGGRRLGFSLDMHEKKAPMPLPQDRTWSLRTSLEREAPLMWMTSLLGDWVRRRKLRKLSRGRHAAWQGALRTYTDSFCTGIRSADGRTVPGTSMQEVDAKLVQLNMTADRHSHNEPEPSKLQIAFISSSPFVDLEMVGTMSFA